MVADLISTLDELTVFDTVHQIDLDTIIQKLNANFIYTAEEVFGKVPGRRKYYKHVNSKPWFNRKCCIARQKFHKTRKRYSFLKNADNRTRMRSASRNYKTTLNKAYSDYQQKAANDLRKLSKNNSKSLLKILNKLNNSQKSVDNDISLQTLYDHFKQLNENDSAGDDQILDFDQNIPEYVDALLNGPVTETEIINIVSNLKNNNASGIDEILNEYIKNTLKDLMPVYIKLFKLICETGLIPECWSIGIMVTIYKNKGSKWDPEMYRGITLNSCFSKTFSAILNKRLNSYADHMNSSLNHKQGFVEDTLQLIMFLYCMH